MYFMGHDVGYSNLKLASGSPEQLGFTKKLPAGAGPVSDLAETISGRKQSGGVYVNVRGDKWVAGVEPHLIWGHRRELHADYTETQSYQALSLAALSYAEQTQVDCVVTGLPMSLFGDKSRRERVKSMLNGHHRLSNGKEVFVKKTLVVGQPMGALYEAYRDPMAYELINNARSAVVDAGFYSLDWTLAERNDILIQSAGTSLFAMSRLLEHMDKLIKDEHGESPTADALERALRDQERFIYLNGEKIRLEPFIKGARSKVAASAIADMRSSFRQERAIDLFILAGGGARDYKQALEQAYPKSQIYMSDDPTTANVRGYIDIAYNQTFSG